jgi:hydrogenase nickel incorporation protein HypA/HybF
VHEYSIASSIVEAVLDQARRRNSGRVVEVQMKIGKLRVLSIDQVKFSYEILSKGTALEGSRFTVQETSGSVRCPKCGYAEEIETNDESFHFGIPPMVCPSCGTNLSIEGGDECIITKVRMLVPTSPKKAKTEEKPPIDS